MKEKYKFLCDLMLGSLCRKLRLFGFDAELNREGEAGRFLVRADREGRVAVTRARRHYDKPPGRLPVVLCSNSVTGQIVELFKALGGEPRFEPFTRCLECNVELVDEAVDTAKAEVPEYIAEHFEEYHRCPSCRRLYWKGSHYEAMVEEIDKIQYEIRGSGD
jgi:uncharacterized protein with PIN domain